MKMDLFLPINYRRIVGCYNIKRCFCPDTFRTHTQGTGDEGYVLLRNRRPAEDDWLKYYWEGHAPEVITRDDAVQRLEPSQRGAARL